LLQEIGANAATLTARSFSVVEGVARQRFGLGITIDFLGLTYSAKNPHSHFSYPQGGIFLPASVAILKASPNRAAAEAFVDFLLSAPGQELLLHPEILRMPVSRRAYAQATDRKSTRLNSSHVKISYAVFCVKKKTLIQH